MHWVCFYSWYMHSMSTSVFNFAIYHSTQKSSCVPITLDKFLRCPSHKYTTSLYVWSQFTTAWLSRQDSPTFCVCCHGFRLSSVIVLTLKKSAIVLVRLSVTLSASSSVQQRLVLITSSHLHFTRLIIDFKLMNRDNLAQKCMEYFSFFLCIQDNRFYSRFVWTILMAAEMVSSAVAQEAVIQILSRIKEGCQDKSDAKEHIERMEMAHIKMEAALETSNKWNVTSAPLLRWQRKLKRALQECDNTLHRCRQRLQE